MSKTDIEKRQGMSGWVESGFDRLSPYRTLGEFDQAIRARAELVNNLPTELLAVRDSMRESLKIAEGQTAICFGEQAAGLQEPVLVLGKRLLANAMRIQFGHTPVEYFADSDVIGSEPGLHSVTLPNPMEKSGIEHIPLIAAGRNDQTPASLAPNSEFNLPHLASTLAKIYSQANPRVNELIGLYYGKLGQEPTVAQLQDAVLKYTESQLGISVRKSLKDIEFDTAIARNGGLDALLKYWPAIVASAKQYPLKGVRVPEAAEAPFYAYLKGIPVRPNVLFGEEPGSFVAVDPRQPEKVLGRFTMQDIQDGRVGITFRAIPRAILLGIMFDGHISGGGAQYNKIVERVFQDVFGIPYYPIAHMDVGEPMQAVFQYNSQATRKLKAPHRDAALNAVQEGTVSAVDMFVSLHDVRGANEAIARAIADPTFTMASRIDLTPFSGGN